MLGRCATLLQCCVVYIACLIDSPLILDLQVHGDVFRPPTNASLLSVYVGTGMQLIGMGVVTMVFAVLGFLSPANRGGLMTAMLLLFVFMGIFGGYYSARLYKIFKVGHQGRGRCLALCCASSCSCTADFVPMELLVDLSGMPSFARASHCIQDSARPLTSC